MTQAEEMARLLAIKDCVDALAAHARKIGPGPPDSCHRHRWAAFDEAAEVIMAMERDRRELGVQP